MPSGAISDIIGETVRDAIIAALIPHRIVLATANKADRASIGIAISASDDVIEFTWADVVV